MAANSIAVTKTNVLEVNWDVVKNVDFEIDTAVLPKSSENHINYKDKEFKLVEIHFHSQSEHQFNGRSAALEAHFFHKVRNFVTDIGRRWNNAGSWSAGRFNRRNRRQRRQDE
jgi:carbonic anhydrase